jgi:carboxyl-terminal processing protease
MTQRIRRVSLRTALLVAVAGLLLVPARAPAEPVLGDQDPLVVKLVCHFLRVNHLARPKLDDELSRRLFSRFLKDLDPYKLYFLQSDIDEFKKQETKLDDQLQKGDISFAYEAYARLVQRLGERLKLVEEYANAAHDFTIKEYFNTDSDSIPWAQTEDDLKDRWRKRIKFDLLLERIEKKPVPEAEAKQKVINRYNSLLKRWKQFDNYELMEMYLTALTTSVDPHSTYMSPATLDDFDISMRLHLEGIGALLRQENGHTIIAEIMPGGAAALDGRLKPNDKIIGVAQGDSKWVDVQEMKLRDVVKMIRGARGTKVQLKVIPAEKLEPVVYEMTRRKIELKNQEARADLVEYGKKPDGTPYRFGIINLPSFYADRGEPQAGDPDGAVKSATEDVRRLLKELKSKGIDGLLLDLRYNGGGSLAEALSLTGLFFDQGPVVQVKGSFGGVRRQDDPEKGTAYDGPMMVLVSRYSASASEILAGCLQDYGRALVVGDVATHGKGTVQMMIDLGSQLQGGSAKLGALKLTTQQFYRVNGESTQARGVKSDVVVPSRSEHLAKLEKELDFALAFDQVKPARHPDLKRVPDDLKKALQARSEERVKKSADFAKLAKEIDLIKAQKARKSIPLNEQELRDQFSKDDAEKSEQKLLGEAEPEQPANGAPYKFKRNFSNNEFLQIMQDFLQGDKLVSGR